MFEIVKYMISVVIDCLPYFIGLWLVFGFIGDLIFGGKK